MRRLDLVGQTFSHLAVLADAGHDKSGNSIWFCKCHKCRNFSAPRGTEMKSGRVKSCGCQVVQAVRRANTTHGLHSKRVYRIWSGMIGRTSRPNHISFKRYGGRGISVCDEWGKDVNAFFEWAHANGYEDTLTIERINNDDDYRPDNCTWISYADQKKNQRPKGKNGMKTFHKTAAQGEVYVQRISSLPDVGLVPVEATKGFLVVSHSESGNSHGFTNDGSVSVMERPQTPSGIGMLYAIVKRPTELRQDASTPHETVRLDEGVYCLRIAREYDPFAEQARRVAD